MKPGSVAICRFSVVLLVLIAALGVGLAVGGPSTRLWVYLALPAAMVAVATVIGSFRRSSTPNRTDTFFCIGFAGTDWLLTVVPSVASGVPETTELMLLSLLRGASIGLLACAGVRAMAVAATLGAFVLVFSAALTPVSLRGVLLTSGVAAATLFLLTQPFARRSEPPKHIGPVAALLGVVVMVATGIAVLTSGHHASARGLYALVRSSGGTASGDDRARSGIGDGPDEVRGGTNAQTSGFDRGDLFVNSDHPGLYDAFIESFGEPVKKSEQLKLIGLKQNQILTSDAHTRQDLRTGRSLQLNRSPPKPREAESDRAAGALLLVRGDVPLRLRLAVFDTYDPAERQWIPAPTPKQNAAWYPNAGGPGWMKPVDPALSPLLGAETAHEIRIGDFESDVLPLPDHLTAFKLGRVDRADWYAGSPASVVRLFGRRMPAGAVLDVRSRPADVSLRSSDPPRESSPHGDIEPAYALQARDWTRGFDRGWGQIQAVESALRHTAHTGQQGSPLVLAHLPLGAPAAAPRSPDYATAAALMLRSLGYSVRLAAGFYVPPDRADPASGLTPVRATDAHVWPEVLTVSGTWVAIEPTPGYHLSRAAPTLTARLKSLGAGLLAVAPAVVPSAAVAVLAFFFRARLTDLLATVLWRLRLPSDPREAARSTIRLIELRARLAGAPRPPGMTLRVFLQSFRLGEPDERVFEWASYAPARTSTMPAERVLPACQRAARLLRFSVLSRSSSTPETP